MSFPNPAFSLNRIKGTRGIGRKRAPGRERAVWETLEPRRLFSAAPIISEFLASNSGGIVDDNGNTSDWIEIYNAGNQAANLGGYTLTDDPDNTSKFVLPNQTLAAGQYLVVFAADDTDTTSGTDIYTGFGLSSSGEYLGLYDPAGNLVSEFAQGGADYPTQITDVSYGQPTDGTSNQPSYFATPTPGAANINPIAGVVDRVSASLSAGFYESAQSVSLSTPTFGATIRYTTDGSTPSATNGTTYTGPITIANTTTLRAIGIRSDFLSLADRTWTYLFVDDVLQQSNDGTAPDGFPAVGSSSQAFDYGIDPEVIGIEGVQAVRDALLSIPSWSITTDSGNLFDESTGIYVNALESGIDWERPASVEQLNPDGSEGFQVNAGLRIRGGFSRQDDNPKHSFRLIFRSEYGDSELNYPIHGDSGTDTFDKIDLRTAQNYSWSREGDPENNFIQDVISRQNQGLTGQPHTQSSWIHLYLNGQYWGLFQTQERVDSDFAQTYLGGDEEDYDVIKVDAGPGAPRTIFASDGNLDAFNNLAQQTYALDSDGSTPNFVNDEAYLRVQGLNPDGTRNESYEALLDVDNLIDYITEIFYSGNFDAPITNFGGNTSLNNWQAIRDRTGDEGFQYFVHDAEHSLRTLSRDRTGPFNHSNFDSFQSFNPQTLHQRLMANEEYRIAFADSIQEKFFNGGIYTTENIIERWDAEAAKISSAIIAESARWGDADTNSPLLKSDWEQAVADVRDNILANRNEVFLGQLRSAIIELRDGNGNYTIEEAAPLFPSVNAPDFQVDGAAQHGGEVPAGAQLDLITGAISGEVYYTTDGSDPRLPGGEINPNATAYNLLMDTDVFTFGSTWRYHDQGADLGTAWRSPSFDDTSWTSAETELGFGDGDEANVISFGDDANNKHITTYFRKTFNLADADYSAATLQLKRDDGAIVYLNGVEIGRSNIQSGAVDFNTTASSAIAGANESTPIQISFDPDLLLAGDNTLAIEIHQISGQSSDLTFDAQLEVATQDVFNPFVFDETTNVQARVLVDGEWSALNSATFEIPVSYSDLRITEIHYNPDNGEEFVEFTNISTVDTLNLEGVTLTEGPSEPFTFGDGASLAPGQSIVITSDGDAFAAAYPGVPLGGVFQGGLSNGGETLTLLDPSGETLISFTYDDAGDWPGAADGDGASLTLIDPATDVAELGDGTRWRASHLLEGTPGTLQDAIAGDYNADGSVSQRDLDLVLLNFGGAAPGNWLAHRPLDTVGQSQLDAVLLNFGNTAPPAGIPAAALLVEATLAATPVNQSESVAQPAPEPTLSAAPEPNATPQTTTPDPATSPQTNTAEIVQPQATELTEVVTSTEPTPSAAPEPNATPQTTTPDPAPIPQTNTAEIVQTQTTELTDVVTSTEPTLSAAPEPNATPQTTTPDPAPILQTNTAEIVQPQITDLTGFVTVPEPALPAAVQTTPDVPAAIPAPAEQPAAAAAVQNQTQVETERDNQDELEDQKRQNHRAWATFLQTEASITSRRDFVGPLPLRTQAPNGETDDLFGPVVAWYTPKFYV